MWDTAGDQFGSLDDVGSLAQFISIAYFYGTMDDFSFNCVVQRRTC